MLHIWKWSLEVTDRQTLQVPAGARFLDVQAQGGAPQIWALCDAAQPKVARQIAIFGTGHPVPSEFQAKYIGTFQMHGGGLVFHAFEVDAVVEA